MALKSGNHAIIARQGKPCRNGKSLSFKSVIFHFHYAKVYPAPAFLVS